MNKMISNLFWLSIPFLFLLIMLPHAGFDPGFYFPIEDKFIEIDLGKIWVFNALYFSIAGFVFKKIKTENYSLTFYGLFTILASFLFYFFMIDDEMIHEAIGAGYASPDTFATRTLIFYCSSIIWIVVQIVFLFKITIHFFNQEETEFELLDNSKF